MKFQEGLTNALTTVAVICAITTTSLLLRREFFPKGRASSNEPKLVKDFRDDAVGHRIGPATAPVVIVEFSDFQCPFCKIFADSTWPIVTKRFREDVALIYRELPIPMHKNAYPAARAAECAAHQGRFEAFHDLLFQKQDSLGIKPYSQFATEAGVVDIAAFNACNSSIQKVADIERDIGAARRLGVRGTPTIFINGKQFPMNPNADELVAQIEKELKNRR